jgi:2',3'-cyclic-nucleotide 2'-phosphodiesterase (5'-nucleotidase family)
MRHILRIIWFGMLHLSFCNVIPFMLPRNTIGKFAAFSLATLLTFSCSRHFNVQKADYEQYGIGSQLPPDSSVIKYYLPYKQKMEAEMNRVIGETEYALTKSSDAETELGNFFSDAGLSEAKKRQSSIQFALVTTKGGIRASIPKGKVIVSDIFELMPFENELVVVKLSGEGMKRVIDFIVASNGQPVSGIRMKIKNKTAYDVTINGEPFDITKTYTGVTSDYLANNGDDQSCFANPLERSNAGLKVRDALMAYIAEQTRNGRKIESKLDGRILIIND